MIHEIREMHIMNMGNYAHGNSISVPANSDDNHYIGTLKIDGKVHYKNYLTHTDLIKGAKMDYDMVDIPNKARGIGEDAKPYSFSREANVVLLRR